MRPDCNAVRFKPEIPACSTLFQFSPDRERTGQPEEFDRIDLQMGQVVSIVGPTGSGKTTLINDIELFADGDTPSGRRVLINGEPAPAEFRYNPAQNPIALITQHTTFLSDLPVREFLLTHSPRAHRRRRVAGSWWPQAIEFANKLTGEPIDLDNRMTELSGGQTRALLIADATVICSTPVVLLDEVENAGIHRTRAVQLLARVPQDLHLRDARSADRPAVRFPHRDAGRPDYAGALDQRRGAGVSVARQPPGRRALGACARSCARCGSRRDSTADANCRRSHETGHLRRARPRPARPRCCATDRAKLLAAGHRVAFLKLDVQYADEDELLAKEFGIPTRKVYSGELCPDHCHVMVLGDALALGRAERRATCCWSKRPGCACAARPTSTADWAWSCWKPPAA